MTCFQFLILQLKPSQRLPIHINEAPLSTGHAETKILTLHYELLICSFSLPDDLLLHSIFHSNAHTACLRAKDPYTKLHRLSGHAKNALPILHLMQLISSFSLPDLLQIPIAETQTLTTAAFELISIHTYRSSTQCRAMPKMHSKFFNSCLFEASSFSITSSSRISTFQPKSCRTATLELRSNSLRVRDQCLGGRGAGGRAGSHSCYFSGRCPWAEEKSFKCSTT